MATKTKTKKNPKSRLPDTQGALLLGSLPEKYESYETADSLIKELKKLFDRKGRKLMLSKTGDEVYYLNQNLRQAVDILEKL